MHSLDIQLYLDRLIEPFSDLMVEAAGWSESDQVNLYTFWEDLDRLTSLLYVTQLSAQQLRMCLSGLWRKLKVLEQSLMHNMSEQLDTIHKILIVITRIVDQQAPNATG